MSNHVTGVIGATVGIGQYIVNDYVITLEPLEGVEGYTITITKGSEVQTATLQGVTPEQYAEMVAYLEQAQTAAQSASENASAAETAATSAAASERSAKSSKDSAASYTSSAYGYAQEAKSARAQAQTAASNASGYKNQAQTAATDAATARSAAESAATRAETAAEQVLGMTVEVETLEPGSEATVSFLEGVLSFGIPAGETGATGNGIASIVKTSTSGNVDTYTITYTSGETSTFTVTNGIDGAVLSVAGKTGAVSLNAGDVAYDESASYADGTVGARVTDLKSALEYITTPSANLFDKTKLLTGYYKNDGTISTSQGQYSPEYIAVTSSGDYAFFPTFTTNSLLICEYDANKDFIQRVIKNGATTTYTAGSTTKYIRIAIASGVMPDTFTFVSGTDVPTGYIDYRRSLDLSQAFTQKIKNVDLNTFTQSGTFTFSTGDGVTNYPASLNAGYIINAYAGTNYRWYQAFIGYNEPDALYVRCKQGSTWTDWAKIKSSDLEIVQASGSSTTAVMSQKAVTDYTDETFGNAAPLVPSINLFDNDGDFVEGKYLRGDGYNTYADASSCYTDFFIPVKGNTQYTWSAGNLATIGVLQIMISTYDANKTGLERITTYGTGNRFHTYTFDATVSYIRLSFYQETVPNDFMFVEGSTLPEVFIPYGKYVPYENIPSHAYLIGNDQKAVWFGDSISMLRELPHLVGRNIGIDVLDCSIAGAPFYQSSSADYTALSVASLIADKIAGDFSAAYDAIDNLAMAGSWSAAEKQRRIDNVASLQNADMSTVTYAVILAGTNDFGDGQEISTFKTGIDTAISSLIVAYPHLHIYIISPPWRGDIATNSRGDTLSDFVDAEAETAEKYAIPFYDVLHRGNINSQNKGLFLNNDQLHPSAAGDVMLAQKCAKWISAN